MVPPLSLAVRFPRVAHYSGNTEKSEGHEVRKHYERAYVVQWAYVVAAALGLDVEVFRRVWVCDTECIAFLRQFVSSPDFFVDYTFKTLVDVLEKARVLTPEFVSCRMDYATRKRSPYGTINEVTQGFIRVGASKVLRAVARSSQEVFDNVFANAVYRLDPAWASALTGVPGRSEGWRVRDAIEVLVGRVNRYYREKESAEFEVDTLRARFSMIGGYERGLTAVRTTRRKTVVAAGLRVIRMSNSKMRKGRRCCWVDAVGTLVGGSCVVVNTWALYRRFFLSQVPCFSYGSCYRFR